MFKTLHGFEFYTLVICNCFEFRHGTGGRTDRISCFGFLKLD
jgi:hypothetical protein